MERKMDRGERNQEKDHIMIDQEEIHEILQKAGTTRSGRPYQYNFYWIMLSLMPMV
jgi:hypothetical protein